MPRAKDPAGPSRFIENIEDPSEVVSQTPNAAKLVSRPKRKARKIRKSDSGGSISSSSTGVHTDRGPGSVPQTITPSTSNSIASCVDHGSTPSSPTQQTDSSSSLRRGQRLAKNNMSHSPNRSPEPYPLSRASPRSRRHHAPTRPNPPMRSIMKKPQSDTSSKRTQAELAKSRRLRQRVRFVLPEGHRDSVTELSPLPANKAVSPLGRVCDIVASPFRKLGFCSRSVDSDDNISSERLRLSRTGSQSYLDLSVIDSSNARTA
ncbi:hypothetical protein DFH11DRAFT_1590252 [Phellopilus nigrolimitatus]|nr:hypothetical protein DFH11DRAFT_1590252 [Phellopilus nigrolimitatus]